MAATTEPDKIAYPTPNDTVVTLSGLFSTLASSIQNALNKITGERQLRTFRWSSLAERNNEDRMEAGDLGYLTATEHRGLYHYTGTSWEKVVPS